MEITFDYMTCENKKFSDIEFQTLRNEMDMRVNTANSHGFSAMSICCTYLVGLMAFIGFFAGFCLKDNTIIGAKAISDCIIAIVIMVLCSLPIYFMMAFSHKFHDNIRVIANLGAYIKVFHDYPSIIESLKNGAKKNNKMTGWELLHCNSVIPNGKKFANEYKTISWIILSLSAIIGIILFVCMSVAHDYFQTFSSGCVIVIFAFFSLCYLVFAGFVIVKTCKNVNVKTLMSKYGKLYFDHYVNLAVSLKLFGEDEAKELKDFDAYKRLHDQAISKEFKDN